MIYELNYTTKEEHIDVQGIMDGLYYPFYMEDCRHKFIKEVMNFDIEHKAKEGINMVLTGYTIKFLRPLKKDDLFKVTCILLQDKAHPAKFHIKQGIYVNEKLYTEATFTATCILASGGRPFLPEDIQELLTTAPEL
ncbi:MAG: thioesterase family protein [Alphaproteobacteria bacterium]|nr:thioesterase family protein [Alphaproteobacteria bacterium]